MRNLLSTIVVLIATLQLSAQVIDSQIYTIPELHKSRVRKNISIPDIMGYKTIKGDFHLHTVYSDGTVLPIVRVQEAWAEGLDAISITDHNGTVPDRMKGDFNSPYDEAIRPAKAMGVTLIPGIEYTDSKPVGHLNFLFIDDANQYQRSLIEPKEAVEMAADKGAFVIYNHPGWPDNNSDLFDFQIDLINRGKIHAVEIFNGRSFYPQAVGYALNKYNLAPFGNTDAHGPISMGQDLSENHRNLTLVFATDNSVEAIKEAMFARRTVAWSANILAGKAEYLDAIMKGSLIVSNYKQTESNFSCMVTNTSDVSYILEGPNYDRIVFPKGETIALTGETKKLSYIYKVTNLFTGTLENLELSLGGIASNISNQVNMPFIKQNVTFFDPEIAIKMEVSTPDSEIRYTLDGSEPNKNSTLYTAPIKLEESCMIKIKGFKAGLEPSMTFSVQAITKNPVPALKVKPKKNGVAYTYYEGGFSSVSQFETRGKKIESGTLDYFDITLAKIEDKFGFDFSGYIYIPETGSYTFTTRSDDGSVFILDGNMIVDNDGSHGEQNVSGQVMLEKGYHEYDLKYFEDFEGQSLKLYWKKPSDESMIEVPASAFYIK